MEFASGEIVPVANLDAMIAAIRRATHRDGFLYPPIERSRAIHVFQPWGRRVKRPAFLYQVPPSHTIRVKRLRKGDGFRSADGAFLMYFVGFMFGYRLQFGRWWLDGRLTMTGRRWSILSQQDEAELLSTAYTSWKGWPAVERARFTNLLYMHTRASSYQWDWERFTINYMVFDGCYEMARSLQLVPKVQHKQRFDVLFKAFGMRRKVRTTRKIVSLRNLLIHEALWSRRQPGRAARSAFALVDQLSRINDRLLWALTGHRGSYVSTTKWSDVGQAKI